LAGLFWRLAAAAPDYAKIAWNGLVSPRLGYRDPVAIAQAVIIRERSVLLAVRRDLRGWELPGGHLKPGESPEAALAREIREETGHKVAIERHVGEYARTGRRRARPRRGRGRLARTCQRDAHRQCSGGVTRSRRLVKTEPEPNP